jgi:hypothetical protein
VTIDIRGYMSRVPEMERFLTVDELRRDMAALAEAHPELARLRRVGTSRLGEPIEMLTIGNGSRQALLFGCPHPNEPIGAMLVHHLAHLLCEDAELRGSLDYTWNLIACIDPDGTRLNEAWFAGPFTPTMYARHFYRPTATEQVEWTFPIAYKNLYFDRTLPETQALMRVIDELRPAFMFSLHNAGFGGVYYYISDPAEPLYPVFHQLPEWEGLALDLGEPEVPWMTTFAPAIYDMVTAREAYDFTEQHGGDPAKHPMGTSSDDYASRYGAFTLVVEMPYFDDPRSNDRTVTETIRREAILRRIALQREQNDFVRGQYERVRADLKAVSPFRLTVEGWTAQAADHLEEQRRWAESDPDTARPATVAELFSNDQMARFYRLLAVGVYLRMLEGEIAIGNHTPAIRESLRESRELFDRWAAELAEATPARPIPIRRLVAVQLGAGLAAAHYLQEREP